MKSWRWILIVGLAVAAVAASAVWWPRVEPVARGEAIAAAAPGVAERSIEPVDHRRELVAVADPVAAARPEPAFETSHSLRLRIVDERGAPLPGAEYFEGTVPASSTAGLSEREAWQQGWHPDTWLTERCSSAVADDGGYVDAHTTDVPRLYVARHGGRLAFWDFPFEPELRFAADRTCKVTVVDFVGQVVAGAVVTLRNLQNSREPVVGVTDAHGVCLVSHLQRLHPDQRDLGYLPRFGVRGLGLRSSDVAFDPALPPEELTLTLPPCGSVSIELLDPSGARLTSPDPVALLGPDGERLCEYTRAVGPVEFGLCAVGLQLAVTTPENHHFAGPSSAAERLVESLRLTDLEPGGYVITGRAWGADGTPLADTKLHAKSALYAFVGMTTSAAAGRFVFVFASESRTRLIGSDGFGIVQCAFVDHIGLVERRGTIVHLADSLRPGIHDVGDVVLRDAIVLARGRVRGAAGPLSGAYLQPSYYGAGLEPVMQAHGRFEVRGLPTWPRIQLEARAKGHVSKEIVQAVPCAELDIVLEPGGR
ncbi:MAG: hypothetical protein ABIP94_08010 [Planctomycetota bacterium]